MNAMKRPKPMMCGYSEQDINLKKMGHKGPFRDLIRERTVP